MDDVNLAFLKLKNHIYYDSSNLKLREEIASFEQSAEFKDRLSLLTKNINKFDINSNYWNELFNGISSFSFLKKISLDKINNYGVISNTTESKNIKTETNEFIRMPIELHICSMIWSIKVGYTLEKKMHIKPYANRINLKCKFNDDTKPDEDGSFYIPYFNQYQKWRDNSISEAKKLLSNNKDVLIFSLDIKNYYNSARINLSNLNSDIGFSDLKYEPIRKIFIEIHKKYTSHLNKKLDLNIEDGISIIPIGLVSSGILSNFYLNELDKDIDLKLNPDFYARYVDDIMIVKSCHKKEQLDEVIDKYLINNSIFKKEEGELISCNSKYSEIRIKNEKLKILHFSSNKSTALLDKFVSDLKKNSSEYRLLPDSDNMDNNFYSSAFYFDYLGDKSKIRNISDIREDKFGISKFLAKQIFLSLQTDIHDNSNNINELVSFFTSESSIELFSLWEKLYTFIVVDGNSISKIPYLTKGIIFNINKMIKCDNIIDNINLINECKSYLLISIAMAISLKPSILLDKIIVNNLCSCFNKPNTEFELRRIVNSIRFSNLCRHNYILQPLLNYKKLPDYHDLEGYHDLVSFPHNNHKLEDLDSHLCLFTPRYIKFHEILLKNIINNVYSNEKSRNNDVLKHSFNEYESINKLSGLPLPFNVIENNESNILRSVDLSNSTTNKTKINIGIVNISTPEKIFKHSYLRNPVLDKYRVKKINNILNQAEIEKVDLLILPEVSIPISLLKTISNFSLKNKIGIIFGLEHIISDNYAYNYIVTLLPVENDGVDSLIVDLRLKNYYSPSEISMLNGYGYKIPVEKQPFYNIFKWRGCRFSIFNCFELSNIEHRAKLKSKIDLLIASEYNKDIGYFSNIIESSSRDLHCYVAQVNDSKYGDSRICQPTSSNNKDIVKVKGGDNSVIISSEIDLTSLREFQIKEYSYQVLNKEYKPTPPDFNKSSIMDLL